MKNLLIGLRALSLLGISAKAQLSNGGIPDSFQANDEHTQTPQLVYPTPDWDVAVAKETLNSKMGFAQPYMVGLFAVTDISFPGSGVFTTADNGTIVWRTQLRINQAPAIGMYFDRFYLPEGVNLL